MKPYLEFCGIPASGKSTLCAGLLGELKTRGFPVMGRAEGVEAGLRARDFGLVGNLLAAVVPGWRREFLGLPRGLNDWHRFVVDHAAFAALVQQWVATDGTTEDWRSCVFYSILATAFEYQLARTARQASVLDEGFAQRFFTLRGYRGLGRPGDAALYAAGMPLPSGLVRVRTPADVCAARLGKREKLPLLLQDEPADAVRARLAEGGVLLDELVADLKRRGIPVLDVDGAGDPASAVAAIVDFAKPILSR